MPFFETSDRTTLFYTDWGTGDPVVFVHGQGLVADMWEYQMLDLTDRGVRCVAYDQRGYDRSDQLGHGYDFDTFADDLAALLGHLDLRGVTLVSYSLGGRVIARYLSRHSTGRVAQAVLVATNTPFLLKTEG
jgi:non-heme chloroperoxidase